jgi:hypothetical protein
VKFRRQIENSRGGKRRRFKSLFIVILEKTGSAGNVQTKCGSLQLPTMPHDSIFKCHDAMTMAGLLAPVFPQTGCILWLYEGQRKTRTGKPQTEKNRRRHTNRNYTENEKGERNRENKSG